ncbi:glycosyltransferase family 2 protein [Acidaminococcus sp. NSJ-142]|uniref:glycosyltransferase family 2 protein n=1 Tax=Acidaminococcus hominis TaxID=2897706 RepID=UPI001E5287D0|nr:glycosyltransferase family 2 protein [Acidaminococcus hominis]MCD2436361.1 glycosyltransferase family 2 protein [Acidaminococcus hominis]
MQKNIVTYIIVTWNNEKQIEDCLDTIQQYTAVPYSVIVVDNCSKDSTCSIIRDKYKYVKLVDIKENLGFAKANNLALKQVETPYVCFINPDIILTEDIIKPSLQILETDSTVGLVACRLNNADGSLQKSWHCFFDQTSAIMDIFHITNLFPKRMLHKVKEKPNNVYRTDWVIGAEMIMRTIEAKKVEGFSTEYFMYVEDMDLCKKVQEILHKITLFIADVSLIHLGGASEKQNTNYKKLQKTFENNILFSKKFYGYAKSKVILQRMICCYRIRLMLLKLLLRGRKKNDYVEHDQNIIKLLLTLRATYNS